MSRSTRSSSRLLAAILVAVLLVAAACSSDEDTSSSGGSGSGGGDSTARGVTDTTIRIAGLTAQTTSARGYAGADLGAQARFERVNRDGGIHGRTIDYLGTRDDGEDPTKNLDLARSLVQQDEVFAIVPAIGQGLLPQSSDFLEEEKVPFVGWGFMPGFCDTSFGFGFNGCTNPPAGDVSNTSLADTLVEALDLGSGDTVAVQGYDADNGKVGVDLLVAAFENADVEVVYEDATMPTTDATDFTPFVEKIMSSDDGDAPTAVAMITLFNNTVGLTGALSAAGYEGATMNYLTYVPGLLESQPEVAAAIDGTYVNTQWLPQEFGGSAIEQIQEDLEAIGESPEIGFATSIGYWAADVMVQMLEAVGKDLTPEKFDEVINGGFTYEPWGDPQGIGPVEFPRDHSQPTPCAAMVQAKGEAYEPIVPMTCYEVIPMG